MQAAGEVVKAGDSSQAVKEVGNEAVAGFASTSGNLSPSLMLSPSPGVPGRETELPSLTAAVSDSERFLPSPLFLHPQPSRLRN